MLKQLLNNLFNKNKEKKEITFVHHEPNIFNIGDYLCSPKHYFDFINPIKNLYIIGGGVFPSLAKRYIKKNKLKKEQVILWAIGESNNKSFATEKLNIDKNFLQVGLRDIASVEEEYFLPCVSCLNSMLDLKILDNNTVVFLNADIEVTQNTNHQFYDELLNNKKWNISFNNCSQNEFEKILQNNQHIITNSYHGAYWGLLSGHNVTILGYSSKFVSLLKMFGFDNDRLIKITRGDKNSILNALESIENLDKSYKLEEPRQVLKEFRNKNINFAKKLKEKSIIKDFNIV